MKNLILLIRPHQWIKNLIVFLPVFFGGALLQWEAVYAGVITTLSFSLTASSIYCLNDIVDVHDDRQHPVKCHRPMASGAVSITQGYILMGLMFVLSMTSTFFIACTSGRNSQCNNLLLAVKYRLLSPFEALCNHWRVCCCLRICTSYPCRRICNRHTSE